ncbi:MAG: hypothetical protein KIT80_03525 [Chitinophagaceae bacterium]|nr:hypothetical protein [Chitinophagaceae bacterium]MCW5925957.1 hypothetical protein [Chitinophagaceae bacterium]
MNKLDGHISQVVSKLQLLIKKYQHLQKEHEKLKKELQDKTNNESALQLKINLLQQQLDILQVASAGSADQQAKTQLEKRINAYIKELDQCIALLSDHR